VLRNLFEGIGGRGGGRCTDHVCAMSVKGGKNCIKKLVFSCSLCVSRHSYN
jgi:hypothetical protein